MKYASGEQVNLGDMVRFDSGADQYTSAKDSGSALASCIVHRASCASRHGARPGLNVLKSREIDEIFK